MVFAQGDVLFLPAGWAHDVYALNSTVSVTFRQPESHSFYGTAQPEAGSGLERALHWDAMERAEQLRTAVTAKGRHVAGVVAPGRPAPDLIKALVGHFAQADDDDLTAVETFLGMEQRSGAGDAMQMPERVRAVVGELDRNHDGAVSNDELTNVFAAAESGMELLARLYSASGS